MPNKLKSIGIPIGAGLLGIGGGALAGSELQKRKLVKAFNAYNQQENSAIAQNFYVRGARAAMSKKADYLEQVTFAAFKDEFEKISGWQGMALGAAKGLWSSAKSLGKGLGQSVGIGGKVTNRVVGANLRRGLPAAGVLGAGAVGTSFMAGRASKPPQQVSNNYQQYSSRT